MTEIELAGETWKVGSDPSFAAVRRLRRREKLLQLRFIDLSNVDATATMQETIQDQVLSDDETAADFLTAQEDFQIQTAICLGTGEWFSAEDLADDGEDAVWAAVNTVHDVLGVDSVNHFFERYRTGQFS